MGRRVDEPHERPKHWTCWWRACEQEAGRRFFLARWLEVGNLALCDEHAHVFLKAQDDGLTPADIWPELDKPDGVTIFGDRGRVGR